MRIVRVLLLGTWWMPLIGAMAQSERPPFDSVRLDRPLPQIFRAGEIYILRGALIDSTRDLLMSAALQLLEGTEDYHKIVETKTHHGRFALALHFRYAGLYGLSLKANYQLLGSLLLKAVEPLKPDSLPLFPIVGFRMWSDNFQPMLIWQTQNELVHLQIQQGGREKSFIISNQNGSFQIDPQELVGFSQADALIRVRGARSLDGSWYEMASDWGPWQQLSCILVENIPPVIDAVVKFNEKFDPSTTVERRLKLDLTIQAYFQPDAYIKRPDGRVDIVQLRSNKRLTEFSIGKDAISAYPEGKCWLEYIPRFYGVYQLEINDAYGKALLNVPFYCGNYFPILPPPKIAIPQSLEKLDLQESRNQMLDQINSIRQRLGYRLLSLDPQLTALSQYYADRMARENFCAHVAPKDGEVLDMRRRKFKIIERIKENVAKAPYLDQAFYSLITSPAHYAAMIDSNMTRVGIGIAVDETRHILVAQHFSTNPYFDDQAEEFLTSLFQKMKAIRGDLTWLTNPPNQPKVTTATYHAASPEKIEHLILSPKGQRIWRHPNVGAVHFLSLIQTADGFKLEIDFYPPTKEQ
ncbi:MAG: CAP domain-containing protein [candidate division KSB1 bacterium]|nr:CAP domain-containing protein [candidate division KSB1 bacterium]